MVEAKASCISNKSTSVTFKLFCESIFCVASIQPDKTNKGSSFTVATEIIFALASVHFPEFFYLKVES